MKNLNSVRIGSDQIERILFFLVTGGLFYLLCTSYFLPMSDLPQHAGQVQALKAMITGQADAPWFSDVELNYFTPYWIGYSLGLVLSFVMPINYAMNVEVGLAFLLFVLAFSALRKRFNGPNILDWILLPSFFSGAYAIGLLTFLVAIPVGVFLIIQNLNWLDKGSRKYALSVVLIGVLLYFSHVLVFLFCCSIAGGMTLVDTRYGIKQKFKKLVPFYALLLFIPVFFLSTEFFAPSALDLHYSRDNSEIMFSRNGYLHRLITLIYQGLPAFSPQNLFFWGEGGFFAITGLFIIAGLLFPWFLGGGLTKDLKRYIPFVACLLAVLCLPSYMGKTAFVYERFCIFIFPLYILLFEKKSINPDSVRSTLTSLFSFIFIGVVLGLLLCVVDTVKKYNKEMESFRVVLDKLPEKKRALSLIYFVALPNTSYTKVHHVSWYQALKHGWVDYNFAWFPPQVIRYKADKVPEARPDFEWTATEFANFKNCDQYDLLVVNAELPEVLAVHDDLMNKSTCSHKLKYYQDPWFVYSRE